MNRRDFLRSLAIGTLGAMLPAVAMASDIDTLADEAWDDYEAGRTEEGGFALSELQPMVISGNTFTITTPIVFDAESGDDLHEIVAALPPGSTLRIRYGAFLLEKTLVIPEGIRLDARDALFMRCFVDDDAPAIVFKGRDPHALMYCTFLR